jgi:hypothetical protein
MPHADGELWALVETLVEGTATAVERERLEARLDAEAQARLFYVAYLDLHAHLQWSTRGESAQPSNTEQPQPRKLEELPESARAFPLAPASRRPWRRRVFGPMSPGAVAAVFALAVGLVIAALVYLHEPGEEDILVVPAPAGSVAVLIDSWNTVWEDDMTLPTKAGSALPPGRLKLRAGVVEVAFNGGGEVLLEGPADFDLNAHDGGFLHRGKLTANVSQGAPPLRVSMPGVVVTDLGGECGLLQDESGLTEIHVFKGQVGADPTDQQGKRLPGKRLLENAGVRVDSARLTMTAVPLNEQAFVALRPEIRVISATVRDGQYAGQSYGTAWLMVKNSIPGYSWESFLRFDLSGVKAKVSKATVRLVPVRLGLPIENAAAFVADNRWAETAITWDTKPASGEAFATWTAEMGKAVEFDVTRLVQEALAEDKLLSLRIFAPHMKRGNSFVQYGSRKGGSEARPELRLAH